MAFSFKKIYILIFFMIYILHVTNGRNNVIVLNEGNWKNTLQDEWMLEFFAPWCPACKGLQNTWNEFATWGATKSLKVGQVDVTLSPGLSGRFMVTALPTIFHVKDGVFRQYKGSRDQESLISFVTQMKWQNVEPVPYWKSPNSFQMSIVSSFFKLSQTLRQIHGKLMDDFGLPTWGSYLIFAIVTIIMGAMLGLLLVCVIDLIYPPKNLNEKQQQKDKKSKSSDDELGDDEIKDDLLDDASQLVQSDKNSKTPRRRNVKDD